VESPDGRGALLSLGTVEVAAPEKRAHAASAASPSLAHSTSNPCCLSV
jgi:hypothetical protein